MKTNIQNCKKTCAITGASSGIGKVTAIELAERGYHVILIVRDSEKSKKAYEEIKSISKSQCVSIFYADLASFESIKKVANEIKLKFGTIDILINNAGIFTRKNRTTEDGFELTFGVNYLATFLLTNLLLPTINKEGGRIINLSSELYKKGKIDKEKLSTTEKFDGQQAYANSKLLVNYFTSELAEKLSDKNISVNCVHPGVVGTDVFREYPKWFNSILNLFISKPKDGAKPVIELATMPENKNVSGKYFYKTKEKPTGEVANDKSLSKHIWETSMKLTKLVD